MLCKTRFILVVGDFFRLDGGGLIPFVGVDLILVVGDLVQLNGGLIGIVGDFSGSTAVLFMSSSSPFSDRRLLYLGPRLLF